MFLGCRIAGFVLDAQGLDESQNDGVHGHRAGGASQGPDECARGHSASEDASETALELWSTV